MGDKFSSFLHIRLARLLVAWLFGFAAGVAVQIQQASLFELTTYLTLAAVALLGLGLAERFFRRDLLSLGMVMMLCGVFSFGLTGLGQLCLQPRP